MRIRIDPARDTFLADHVAGGQPVLPTVMQLDLVVRGPLAAGARGAGAVAPAGMLLRDVAVGPPLRFTGPDARDLNLACTPYRPAGTRDAAIRCELRTPGETVPHPTAVAAFTAGPAPRPPGGEPWLPCGALAPGSLAADAAVPALARVVPRSGPRGHGRVFDGQVAADDGSVLVTVTGYRTTGLDLTPQSSEGTSR